METPARYEVDDDGSTESEPPESLDPELETMNYVEDVITNRFRGNWQAQCRIVRWLYSRIVKTPPELDAA